mmetsp:Transcript_3287/g.5455  ORF Transcript_3287/g.5455 Transcript_3287/m.5455 type:complete len:112 (+) Transcript_3287:546-881(+)
MEECECERLQDWQFDVHLCKELKRYENFRMKDHQYMDLFLFSWQIHGMDVFQKFLPFTAQKVNWLIEHALNMTSNSLGSKDEKVDTSSLRMSIVYYLMLIYGMREETQIYK